MNQTVLNDFTDEELWTEVERRELVTQIGWINPDLKSQYNEQRYVLWDKHWSNRWPVFGLRGGDTIKSCLDESVVGRST